MRDELIELIKAGKTCSNINTPYVDNCDDCRYVDTLECIVERIADTLIANGVTVQKHGQQEKSKESDEWYGKYFTCFECRTRTMAIDPNFDLIEPSYCPNCGAKMDVIDK